jgi:hypothetical protein
MKNYFPLSSIVLVFVASFFVGFADPRTSVNMDATSLNELVNATALNELVNATALNELVNATALNELVNATALNELVNATALKKLVIDSENIQIVNSTNGNTTYNINILTLGASAVNRTSKSVKVVIAPLILPVGDVVNANTISAEVYIVNDTLYIKADGNWTSTRLVLSGGLGTGQDRVRQSAMLMNESDIKLVGAGDVDGEKCLIVEITPQSGAVSSLI